MTDVTASPANLSALKLSLMAQRAREQVAHIARAEPIAIVGMGCRFPGGADTPDRYWRVLSEGIDTVKEIPPDRWDLEPTFDPDPAVPGKSSIRHAGLLDRIDLFDAGFFGTLPREAERMDPQQRLFMEVSIDALDHAGLSREQLAGSRTGVFVASYHNDYARMQYADLEWVDSRTLTGTLHSIIANRISHFLDLRGPSLSLDSACSSSLVAVHLACQSLRTGETDIALAGGVSVLASPDLMVTLSKVGFTSKSGRCRTFDAAADGFVRGEGCGVVVLKRLSDAVAAGDRIHAVVRSSVVNQDGHSTVLAAPNGLAQQALVREALEHAGIAPERVGFVETHGTGTALGDPIEVEALVAIVGAPRPDGGVCYLGAAKANLGHLEAAAGIAGLIKATLVLQHGLVPPQIHFDKPNPHLALEGTCLRITRALQPLPAGALPRVAGVSSFGVGGTNAHVIVEEAPLISAGAEADAGVGPFLLPLSAQSANALKATAERWIEFLGATEFSAATLCATAAERRSHYDCRLALIGSTPAEFRDHLRAFVGRTASPHVVIGHRPPSGRPRLAFVFCGQGPQWFAMGRELAEHEPVFRDALKEIDGHFRAGAGWSLIEELSAPEEQSRLGETQFAQPALFALQVALAALWKSWGIEPDGVVGHSIGELAALHVSGALSLPEAVRVVWNRARIMQRATGLGAMAAVGIDEREAKRLVRPYGEALSIAALNSPSGVVLSGRSDALDAALSELERRGGSHRRLPVNYAFHSAQMTALASEFAKAIGAVSAHAPTVSFYSTVTGQAESSLRPDANYFARNVRQPVRFAAAIDSMLGDEFTVFLEIGPRPVLAAAIAETAAARNAKVSLLASLRRERLERESMLQACAGIYALGQAPRWEALNPASPVVLDLPSYPWQRERYWLRERPIGQQRSSATGGARVAHELLGRRIPAAAVDLYGASWPETAPEWLAEHRVAGRLLMPAAAMLEALRAAAAEALHADDVTIEDFVVHHPLVLGEPGEPSVAWQVTVQPAVDGRVDVSLHEEIASGARDPGWRLVAFASATGAGSAERATTGASSLSAPAGTIATDQLYSAFAGLGIAFGSRFQTIKSARFANSQASVVLELAADLHPASTAARSAIHPTVLDGALQSCLIAAAGASGLPKQRLLPLGIDRFTTFAPAPARLHAFTAARRESDGGSLAADIEMRAPDGTLVARLNGARFALADSLSVLGREPADNALHEIAWHAMPRTETPSEAADQAWIILADNQGYGDALAAELQVKGARCLRVRASHEFARVEPDVWTIDPAQPAHSESLLAESVWRDGAPLAGIVHLWSLDIEPLPRQSGLAAAVADFERDDLLTGGSALHAVQALARSANAGAKLAFVTCGAQAAGRPVMRPAAAALWGLLNTVAVELPDLDCRVVDLDPDVLALDVTALIPELLRSKGGPRRLALRGSQRLAPRIRHFELKECRAERVYLQTGEAGTLDDLSWRPSASAAPGPGEVRVRVVASGLNFRDVLLALGAYPGSVGLRLGSECSGTVEAVGSGVTRLKPGDAVFGLASGTLATEFTASADLLAHVPAGISMESAAALPVAYLSAMFGLRRLAGVRAGMRVLIHSAAGGVGMAAVQLALGAGVEVFATAGSPAKRDILRRMGAHHVLDSRSTAFADGILEITNGAGVDIVLNSFSGEFIAAGFRSLACGGCFLELGKRDIWSAEQAARLRPDARYIVYDLGVEANANRTLVPGLMDELIAELGAGRLHPLPVRVFEFCEAQEAFRFMAQARHVGKLVLRAPDVGMPRLSADQVVRPDATYLVTGGLGALGLRTAEWLVTSGARHLVLTGRHPPSSDAAAMIERYRRDGANVVVRTVDAGDQSTMSVLFEDIRTNLPPLRGAVHAAGIVDDGVLLQQDWRRWRGVLHGKAHGARVLHALTRDLGLDFFVLYSAAGLLLGPAGQGGYAAANAELDALAHARRAAGLPALSVAWGMWSDGGMATRMAAAGNDVWSGRGLGWLAPADAFVQLERLLRGRVTHAAVMPMDWARFMAALPTGADHDDFRDVAPADAARAAGVANAAAAPSVAGAWRAASLNQRRSLVLAHVLKQALNVLGVDSTTAIAPGLPLKEVGLDSLMAVELRNTLTRSIERSLPATLLFDYPTLDALTTYLMRVLQLDEGTVPADAPTVAAADIAELSDEEAEAELLAELESTTQTAVL